ncbi:hypothetical protein H5410_011725 [Solanum commersonii]|uniref:Cytochrome b/b6 N-terminal region profile domain-containing protein n=1 Tax=Solanum commersonii TaxID=4109 RepID=A0A9J6AQH3_SOLCO|nr:hypothetical protein H5410_011725 [Solanum commersonii]
MGSELNKFQTFYSISVATSIWVFLLELYEMKVSYTVLRGSSAYLNKVYDWFEERLEIQAIADDITIQVATGFAMTFYYRPTVTEAFASVQYIMTEANFGWLIRSVHRWSASMMVLMMILHVFRVYLTGGVVLAVLTASFGVTGYSLPWDQIGYWGENSNRCPCAIPVIGSPLVELLRGSASVGQSTLTRFIVYTLLYCRFLLPYMPPHGNSQPNVSLLFQSPCKPYTEDRLFPRGWIYKNSPIPITKKPDLNDPVLRAKLAKGYGS